MADKRKLFKDVVFEVMKDAEEFDKVEYTMLRAYDIFSREMDSFKKLSVLNQYWICHTAGLISLGSAMATMRRLSVFKKKDPSKTEINFSLEYGFKETDLLNISSKQQKLIK